jgi:hypothetical protein
MNEPPPSSDQLVATVAEDGRVAINGEAIPIDNWPTRCVRCFRTEQKDHLL